MRRIIIYFNFIVVILFLALWLILFFYQDRYVESGFTRLSGSNQAYNHFSSQFPFVIAKNDAILGIVTLPTDSIFARGFWQTTLAKPQVRYFLLPDSMRFKKAVSLFSLTSDIYLLLTQLNDSEYVVFRIDSTIHVEKRFKLHAPVVSVLRFKNLWWMFIEGKRGIGTDAYCLDSETFDKKTYVPPTFFKNILQLVGVVNDGNKLKFLYASTHRELNGKWVKYDTSSMAYFVVYEERHVFPLNYFKIDAPLHRVVKQIRAKQFGLLQNILYDKTWEFQKDSLVEKNCSTPKGGTVFIIGRDVVKFMNTLSKFRTSHKILHFWDEQNNYHALLFQKIGDKLHLVSRGKAHAFFYLHKDEPQLYLPLAKDTFMLITRGMKYSYLVGYGEPLKHKTFFTRVHSRIFEQFPAKIFFLETFIPEVRALWMFTLLYGLPVLIAFSIFVFYVYDTFRHESVFGEKKVTPLYIRFFVPSFVYFIVLIWKIGDFFALFSLM